MAWTPTIPAEPPVPVGWWIERKWDAAVAATLAERDAAREAKWVLPALAARARRYIRTIDEALAPACDCVAEGYKSGCRWCRPDVDRRHIGPTAGHGVEARWAGPVEHTHFTGARVLSVR